MSLDRLSRARKLLLGSGLGVLILAAAANPLGLSASSGLSRGKILLAGLGLALLIAGLLGRSIVGLYTGAAVFLLNTVVLFMLFDASLLFMARIGDVFSEESPHETERLRYIGDGREQLPYYQKQEWAGEFWREYHQAWNPDRMDFEPYLLWKTPPFDGKTIRIEDHGIRQTPASRCEADSLLVFTLGGSAMWGTGVPDWETVANHLAIALNKRLEPPVCIRNLAEQAYVSTQELLRLIFELRSGLTPDIVIFYDGINDVFAGYQTGRAGQPQNIDEMRLRLEHDSSSSGLLEKLETTRTVRLARKLVGRQRPRVNPLDPRARGLDLGRLASEIAALTSQNYALATSLGDQFGFSTHFFWQPLMLLDKKPMTEEEASIFGIADGVHPGLSELFQRTYAAMGDASPERIEIQFLTDLFEEETQLVYIDPWHVTAEANARIARAISAHLEPAVPRRQQP